MSQNGVGFKNWFQSLSTLIQLEVVARYQGTHLGWAWAVIKPVCFVLLLHLVAHHQSLRNSGAPYSVFALVAWIPWQFFSEGFTRSTTAIRSKKQEFRQQDLHTKAVPASLALAGLGDFLVGLFVLALTVLVAGIRLPVNIVALPLFCLILLMTVLGVSYFVAAWHAQLPDAPQVIQLISRGWLMLTPVFYPTHLIGVKQYLIFCLNPMVGVVEGFRWCFLGTEPQSWAGIAVSSSVAVVVFVFGTGYFHRNQERVLEEVFLARHPL